MSTDDLDDHDELIDNLILNSRPGMRDDLIDIVEEHRNAGLLRKPELARKIARELLRRGLDSKGTPIRR